MTKHRLLMSALASLLVFAPVAANAQLFGPSDEEKAREDAQDKGVQELTGKKFAALSHEQQLARKSHARSHGFASA